MLAFADVDEHVDGIMLLIFLYRRYVRNQRIGLQRRWRVSASTFTAFTDGLKNVFLATCGKCAR